MTRTARRRWTRELEMLVDGIAVGEAGPVLVHGYDDPAGGKWIESVIPGKLAALDRGTGELRWISPCEVGYGRGFGAGLGSENDAVVLGPSSQGHRIVRMSLDSGELIGAAEIEPFDEALVYGDVCICVTPERVSGIMTSAMIEIWSHSADGKRFHQVCREGGTVYVVYGDAKTGRQGMLCLDAESGEYKGQLIEPKQKVIYGAVIEKGILIVLLSDLFATLPEEQWAQADGIGQGGGLNLLAVSTRKEPGEPALWFDRIAVDPGDEFPDVHIWMDSGKLYLVREALVEVRDGLSGRNLGELTLPGLDERVAWDISQGAGLLAEEQRVSIYEIPV